MVVLLSGCVNACETDVGLVAARGIWRVETKKSRIGFKDIILGTYGNTISFH